MKLDEWEKQEDKLCGSTSTGAMRRQSSLAYTRIFSPGNSQLETVSYRAVTGTLARRRVLCFYSLLVWCFRSLPHNLVVIPGKLAIPLKDGSASG
jgi:hypothetical protein